MKTLIILSLLLSGCTQLVPSRTDIVTSGTNTIEITVSVKLIDQLKTLCEDQLAPLDYPSLSLRKKAVSDCVFEHLQTIGASTSAIGSFVDTYCGPNANYTGLTPGQITSLAASCAALGN